MMTVNDRESTRQEVQADADALNDLKMWPSWVIDSVQALLHGDRQLSGPCDRS